MKEIDAHPGTELQNKPWIKALLDIANAKNALKSETKDTQRNGAPVVANIDLIPKFSNDLKLYFDFPAFLRFLS